MLPYSQMKELLKGNSYQQESKAIVRQLLQSTELDLMDILAFLPKSYIANEFQQMIQTFLKVNETAVSLTYMFQFLIEGLYAGSGDTAHKEALLKKIDCQSALELFNSILFKLARAMKLTSLDPLETVVKQFKPSPEQLLPLYYEIQAVRKDKRESQYWNGHLEQLSKSLVLRGVEATGVKAYQKLLACFIRSTIKSALYSFMRKDNKQYTEKLNELFLKNNKTQFACEKFLIFEQSESLLVNMLGECMHEIATASTSTKCQRSILLFLMLYIESSRHKMSKHYNGIRLIMIKRLFIQGLTRWGCEHSLVLLTYRSAITATFDHAAEFSELEQILSETILSVYSILIEKESLTELQSTILKECKKHAIQLIRQPIINNQMFLKRDWQDTELQQHIAERFSKGKYIKDADTAVGHIRSLIGLLRDACEKYQLERVYLCLLHLRDYLIPLNQSGEQFSSELFPAVDRSLACITNYYKRLKSSSRTTELTVAIQLLCSWHITHCNIKKHIDCIQTKCELSEVFQYRHNLSNAQKNAKRIRKFINEKRYFFGISEIYNSSKLVQANDESQGTMSKGTLYPERDEFVLREWVINLCIMYKLRKDVTRFFETVAMVSLQQSVCNLLFPLLIQHICSQQKFSDSMLREQLLNLFDKWLFTKKMPLEYRNAFLNIPEVLGVWKNQSGSYKGVSPEKVIRNIYNQLDQYKLSKQYASSKNYKGAIRRLERYLQISPASMDSQTLLELYCYEAQLNYDLRQISFQTILHQLKIDPGKEHSQLTKLLDRDKMYFNRALSRCELWIGAINKNRPLKEIQYANDYDELNIAICRQVAEMQTRREKQNMYILLKMTNHLVRILKLCQAQQLTIEKQNELLTKQCHLRRTQYSKLLQSTHQLTPLELLVNNIKSIIDLDLVQSFKSALFKTLHSAITEFQKWFNCKDKPNGPRSIIEAEIVQFYFEIQKYEQLQGILGRQHMIDLIRLAYEKKEYLIALQESQSLIASYSQKQLKGVCGWVELFFYFFSCKKKLTWTQMNLMKPLQNVKDITYHKSQIEHLLLLLNVMYIEYLLNRNQLEILLKIATNWLIWSLQDDIMEGSRKILFTILKIMLDKVEESDLPTFSSIVLNLLQKKASLIDSDIIEMLINRINIEYNHSTDFIAEILHIAAMNQPNSALFWLMRLIHYCDICFEDNPKLNVDNLINENDRLKQRIGQSIFKSIEIDKESVAFAQYLYGTFKMRKQVKASSNGKKVSDAEKKMKWLLYSDTKPDITKYVYIPFSRQLRVTKVIGPKNIDNNSKCMTKLVQVYSIEDIQKEKGFRAQFLLKAQFKANNRGHEQRASKLFRCIIPPQLKITYTILELSKYLIMVEFMDGYETVKKILSRLNSTKQQRSIRNSRIYSQINRSEPFEIAYFKHINNIQPVLQLLIQRKTTLDEWWNARSNYIKTTAVWSMVGYIFGLGDRHSGNIMVHPDTCKVLHIDYECFMDSGKNLPIPQYVPFRMTKNIEAPMGLFGAFGYFYIYSVKFVRTLQRKWDTIIDCIDQFRVDQSKEAFIKQVLDRLNFTRYSSTEEGVLKIIRDSKNHQLLSKMFHGWNALQ